ncbi:proton-coupled zinc antiporter SLC30A5-like isoform X2 [Physella acuta]|uniref:proton-coupled zinc antiporter SLC30A5-like isoform X2 n=1 Tax=Physella acuta TaxID=109671 RepID=UPI0027DBB4F3|nr:proton-coupled zinc antiporter SLC30A5-like isoform X2 [Physella acuta]
MVQRLTNNGLPSRSFHSSSGLSVYIVLLIVSKVLKAVGLFIAYDLLKLIPIVVFLFLLKAGTALPLVFLQKPFSSGPQISKHQWFRIWRHALLGTGIHFLWIFGLTLCGPLRTIVLFEHSELVVIAGASALFSSSGPGGGPAKARGAIFFIVAVLSLLVFDHDEKLSQMGDHENESIHHNILTHIFKHGIDFLGWSDHKGGVLLLFLTLCLHSGYNSASKKLSVEVGGAKRLHSLSTLVSTGLLWPWACFIYISTENEIQSWLYLIFPLLLVILFVGVFDFYIESLASSHLQPIKAVFLAPAAMFSAAIVLSLTWTHPYITRVTTLHKLDDIITEDHVLSGGVIFSVFAFLLATRMVMARGRAAKGSFIGYNPAGLPLYSISSEALQKTSQSIISVLKSGLRQILEDGDSRKIFYFLCINLCFTFVELLYGVWTNSLGLISDGFHMLFDCSALVMGLYASIMVRWKATRVFSFGYDRVEVLSGFVNGLFLVVIALFVFAEALARMFEPPEVITERLLTVSVMGLLVNLIGIVAFQSSLSHGHSHGGGGHGHSHGGGGHGHSHGGGGHGHSHGAGSQECSSSPAVSHGHAHHNTNMEGVFLHVVADTMGSVGVIVSTLLIENFGWNIADPICSLFIATMIFLSVIPLLKETAVILILRSPTDVDDSIHTALHKITTLEGVLSYREPHFWSHTANKIFGMIHIQVWPQAQEQRIIAQVTSIFKDAGISSITVQVEKQSYFFHLSGLGATPINISQFSQQSVHNLSEPLSIKAV